MLYVVSQKGFLLPFNRMTEEEKQEAKEQLRSLHQAYSELSQQCADATSSADQVRYSATANQMVVIYGHYCVQSVNFLSNCMTNIVLTA